MEYGRVCTALAMATAEVSALRQRLEKVARGLRQLADEMEGAYDYEGEAQSWWEVARKEQEEQRARCRHD